MTDSHVLELSHRISNSNLLLELGINVLKLQHDDIDATLRDNCYDIENAAYCILMPWYEAQADKQQAYDALYSGLKENKLHLIATELRDWIERPEQAGQQQPADRECTPCQLAPNTLNSKMLFM